MLLGYTELLINQLLQVLLLRTALKPFSVQSVSVLGIALTHLQDLALGLAELHDVHTNSLLKLVPVPLDDILFLRPVSHTTQLDVICKLSEGAPDSTVYVIDEDIKQYWSPDGPLKDTPCHRSPSGHSAFDHYHATIQLTFPPLKSPPIKSTSLQISEKDVVGDHVIRYIQNYFINTHQNS